LVESHGCPFFFRSFFPGFFSVTMDSFTRPHYPKPITMKKHRVKYRKASSIRKRIGLGVLVVLGSGWFTLTESGEVKTVARILPSGAEIELISHGEMGQHKTTVPVYQSAGARYFSAGVGLDQREADYPTFSLKLIFVEGARALTSNANVVINNEEGTLLLNIPAEHVRGPWLFVDLPMDVYTITATRKGHTLIKPSVSTRPEKNRTLYLRWPDKD
jgi:hypothetical protein